MADLFWIFRGPSRRKRRLLELVDRIEQLEGEMRDACAAVLELTHPDDDLAGEVRRILAALDG